MGTLRTFADVYASPARGLAAAAEKKSILPPILAATLLSLVVAAVLVPRLDWDATARAAFDKMPNAAQMTQHEAEEKTTTIRKVGTVTSYAGGLVGPAVVVVVAAFFLWIGLRTAGARPGFVPVLAVSSWAISLPGLVSRVLFIPALLGHERLDPQGVASLPAWTLSHWLPATVQGPALALASSINLFTFWSIGLLVVGLAPVAGVTRARAGAVVGVLWALVTAAGMAAAGASGAGR